MDVWLGKSFNVYNKDTDSYIDISIDDISPDALAVYIALRKIMLDDISEYYISIHMISFILTCTAGYQKRFYISIKNGLKQLIEYKLVSIVGDPLTDNDYIVNLDKIVLDTKKVSIDKKKIYFTIIGYDEIKTIMQIQPTISNNGKKVSIDKFKLLKYFIICIGSINFNAFIYEGTESINNFVGGLTLDTLSNKSNINKTTAIDYNNKLESLQLLYIHKSDDFIIKDDKLKRVNNAYGRYKNKDNIIRYVSTKADAINSVKCNKQSNRNKANDKNRLLQRYNALYNGYEYEEDVIKEIYNFILIYNAEQDKVIEFYKNDTSNYAIEQTEKAEYKKKDIDIFDQFNFL